MMSQIDLFENLISDKSAWFCITVCKIIIIIILLLTNFSLEH